MRYLFGDSTESNLDFNYLAFLRDVVDCAVVLLEAELTIAANVERRNTRKSEIAGLIRAVEDLGKEASALVEPVAKQHAKHPVGRCAAAIATAIRDAVARESAHTGDELAAIHAELDREDNDARKRARGVLEKLLRSHDLPGARKELEITWLGDRAKATLRESTDFGVEVEVALDATGSAMFGSELRVERIDPTLEIHSYEAGGWLKKGDKLVANKLGRYQVVGVTLADYTTIELRAVADATGTGLTIIVRDDGDIMIEGSGNNASKRFAIEDRDRVGIQQLAETLATALRGLDQRTAVVSETIDGKSLAQHEHPRVLAERLIAAIAPTVRKIIDHGRNPGELVLRRQLADDRREEIYVPISELVRKIEVLPSHARAVFAALRLGGESAEPAVVERKPRDTKQPIAIPEIRQSNLEPAPHGRKSTGPRLLDTKAEQPEGRLVEILVGEDATWSDGIPDVKGSDPKLAESNVWASKLADAKQSEPKSDTRPYDVRPQPRASTPSSPGFDPKIASALAVNTPRDRPKTAPPPTGLQPPAESSQPILAVTPIGTSPSKFEDDDGEDKNTSPPK